MSKPPANFTVYARLEPTTDSVLIDAAARAAKIGNKMEKRALSLSSYDNMDVQVYHDREATRPYGRHPANHRQSKPKYKRTKYTTMNCVNYNLVWLPPLVFKVEDGGVYMGEDLMGEFLDGRFLPNLDLMNQPECVQKAAEAFAARHLAAV